MWALRRNGEAARPMKLQIYKALYYRTRAEADAAAKRERGHGTTVKITRSGNVGLPYFVVFRRPVR